MVLSGASCPVGGALHGAQQHIAEASTGWQRLTGFILEVITTILCPLSMRTVADLVEPDYTEESWLCWAGFAVEQFTLTWEEQLAFQNKNTFWIRRMVEKETKQVTDVAVRKSSINRGGALWHILSVCSSALPFPADFKPDLASCASPIAAMKTWPQSLRQPEEWKQQEKQWACCFWTKAAPLMRQETLPSIHKGMQLLWVQLSLDEPSPTCICYHLIQYKEEGVWSHRSETHFITIKFSLWMNFVSCCHGSHICHICCWRLSQPSPPSVLSCGYLMFWNVTSVWTIMWPASWDSYVLSLSSARCCEVVLHSLEKLVDVVQAHSGHHMLSNLFGDGRSLRLVVCETHLHLCDLNWLSIGYSLCPMSHWAEDMLVQ